MKSRCLHLISLVLLGMLFLLLPGVAAVAANNSTSGKQVPGTIADTWVMWPKEGQSTEFEAAIKQHATWRKNNGENFDWSVYQPVVGKDLSFYVIRSGHHQWKDFDTQAAWETKAKSGDSFQRQVGPYLARAEHYFAETDLAHSHWIDNKDYRYFSVTSYALKSGSHADRTDALNKIKKAISDENWTYPYEISNEIGGTEPMLIVVPMANYAAMADPDPSLMNVLAKSEGSDAAAATTMKQFGGTIEHASNTIYEYRPDLSTPK